MCYTLCGAATPAALVWHLRTLLTFLPYLPYLHSYLLTYSPADIDVLGDDKVVLNTSRHMVGYDKRLPGMGGFRTGYVKFDHTLCVHDLPRWVSWGSWVAALGKASIRGFAECVRAGRGHSVGQSAVHTPHPLALSLLNAPSRSVRSPAYLLRYFPYLLSFLPYSLFAQVRRRHLGGGHQTQSRLLRRPSAGWRGQSALGGDARGGARSGQESLPK